ncbi:hypothetical protein [Chamaesiphon polymorphus]|uniref:hypothetical protein n=1 Tax=Chamaesiphon polymorphus TaxID=2107691 RepID=UPI001C62D251|nr:hypothetical protein [Chamaesiphon polymorphus]
MLENLGIVVRPRSHLRSIWSVVIYDRRKSLLDKLKLSELDLLFENIRASLKPCTQALF